VIPDPPSRSPCTPDTQRCEFWTWGEDTKRPACCTEHLLELARFVDSALVGRGLVHWLDYGSLLGAVRDGQLIPWDDDVDFGYLHDDHDLVVEALVTASSGTTYEIDLATPDVIFVHFSSVNRQHADLFPWDRVDGRLTPRFEAPLAWPGISERESFPARFIEDLEPVSLAGHAFSAPSPVHEFLERHRYGPDYLIPARGLVWMPAAEAITICDFTPAASRLWEEAGRQERRLLGLRPQLGDGRQSLRKRWIDAARPLAPDRARVERHLETIPLKDRNDAIVMLADHLALLEQTADELEHPPRFARTRRAARRAHRVVRRCFRNARSAFTRSSR
jgi:hypothetical protein